MPHQPASQTNWENIKTIAEIIGALAFLISIVTGPWGLQIPEMPYYISVAAAFLLSLLFIWVSRSFSSRRRIILTILSIGAALGLGFAYWRFSRPAFEITALNTLPGDQQAYEITDYLIWNQDPSILGKYQIETKFEIQIVSNYFGKSHFGEVALRISSEKDGPVCFEKSLWSDFAADALTQKFTLTLSELIKCSGIKENSGLENRLEKFDYRQGKMFVQVFPIANPDQIWATQEIIVRNAPWQELIELSNRNGQHFVDVYLKNYGDPGQFFTHYKLVRLNDVGTTSLEHGTNSATTRLDGGIIEVAPATLGVNQETTFSIPLNYPTTPGRYAVEVYTVKRQIFVNWDVAYGNAPWWFSPTSRIEYFIIKTSQNTSQTPFEVEAARLRVEQGIDLGVPVGPIEEVKSRRDTQGQSQAFTNGMVIIYDGQAFALYGAIYQHYKAINNGYFPTSPITTLQRDKHAPVDKMEFEPVGDSDMPSVIYANAQYAAWMEGWVRKVYENSGGVNGWLGLPVSDLMYQMDTDTQAFENGYIVYYFPEVNGERDYGRPPVILPYASTLGANGKIFDVQAAPWQDTGLEVKEGDIIWVEYIGGGWTDSTETTPETYSASGNGLLGYADGAISDKAVVGALIARVGGENGRIYTIGRWAVIIAPVSGKLELAMNDNSYEHNAGFVTVKIDITAK